MYVRSPHGTTKIERRSFGTGTIAAMSLRTFSHGTVMWMPFAGRIECGCVALVERADVVGEHAGRVHDRLGPDRDLAAVGGDGRAGHPPVGVLRERGDAAVVRDDRAVRGRGAGEQEREAGVVGLGVVVEVRRRDVRLAQRGHVRERGLLVDALVQLLDARAAGEVVHPQRAAERPGDLRVDEAVAAEHRDEERQHPHEVRRVAQRALALVERVVDEPDLLLLQVAQPAVDELRRLRRRPAREVVPLDERGAQAPGGGVEGDAAAGDPAADDEDVELLGREAVERDRAVETGHRARLPVGHSGDSGRTRAGPRGGHRSGTSAARDETTG